MNIAVRTDRLFEMWPADFTYAVPQHVEDPKTCFFYHSLELPTLGLQEGAWDLRSNFDAYIGHVNLEDKRVLDVGAASGFLSFSAEKAGAREVVSFDLDTAERQHLLPFVGSRYVEDHDGWCADQTEAFMAWKRSYWLAHRLYGSRVKAAYGDVYNPPATMGAFDVVILGAILEHLIDPLSAIRALSRHAADIIVINTDFVDSGERIARFNGRLNRPENSYVFWTYSIPLYDEYMKILGFKPIGAHRAKFASRRLQWDAPRLKEERVALVYQRE